MEKADGTIERLKEAARTVGDGGSSNNFKKSARIVIKFNGPAELENEGNLCIYYEYFYHSDYILRNLIVFH